MKYTAVVLSVADVKAARGFYEDLFGLEVCQDYGINVSFTCGLSLQQEFDWLVGLQKERIGKKSNNMELCFETEDLDHFLEQLRRYPGAERLGDVVEHGWGQRVVRFYDLDGHLVEVGGGHGHGGPAFPPQRDDHGRSVRQDGCLHGGPGEAAGERHRRPLLSVPAGMKSH